MSQDITLILKQGEEIVYQNVILRGAPVPPPLRNPPATPSSPSIEKGQYDMTLQVTPARVSWTQTDRAMAYLIDYREQSGDWQTLATIENGGASGSELVGFPSSAYECSIVAYNPDGERRSAPTVI